MNYIGGMKNSRAFVLAVAALFIGFFAARWCGAQSPQPAAGKEPTSDDFGALQQLESFVTYLQDTKQTNILERFNDYSNASLALQYCADLGITMNILQLLRDGHTNEVYKFLETKLDDDIVTFAASYRQLPASLRDKTSLEILERAKNYRAKHPAPYHFADQAVTNAFKLLDAPATK